ncbi:hypothetical protein GCM10010112_40900 [Actinoplanes lobatus]|uniref:SAM-dependent methyltransferase n=1 Tax=Actinoplanes lobatus TaxID=113568 RepID=A0A7W7ML61_9ACTN|nr:class I SAM-dependent methyltransferase [Actinoplanes lobatus]MBB4753795.1 SAM-dependent methyltransferase [Actinoplanes lobatus]GGN72504.1 hypothetical protein GCM10010112_40900 [Actinoplanes lobatus]GIE42052.1 hypothetical protein Alo02nite_49500 [Actinoplanes lobatus]
MTYWDTVGATKTFTHPLHHPWLAGIDPAARILDYGCGYGRTMAELVTLGFPDVSGVDVSPAVIARGRREHPDLDLGVIASPPTVDRPASGADVVVLFAVLTCVPEDEAQTALAAEVTRLLAPGGLLYVSDLLLRPGRPAVFTTSDGAVCRHHERDHLLRLFAGFDLVAERHLDVTTMNGNPASGIQLLLRRGEDDAGVVGGADPL